MKFIATYRNTRHDNDRKYSINADNLFEADEKAQAIAEKEGWIYTSITPAEAEI